MLVSDGHHGGREVAGGLGAGISEGDKGRSCPEGSSGFKERPCIHSWRLGEVRVGGPAM